MLFSEHNVHAYMHYAVLDSYNQLVKSKCIPILLYGLEVCELNKSQMASLDFTINRFL